MASRGGSRPGSLSAPAEEPAPETPEERALRKRAKHAAARMVDFPLDNKRLMRLVDDMLLPSSLPAGWVSKYDEANDSWTYRFKGSSQELYVHPLIEYYHGAAFMDQGGYRHLMQQLELQRPTGEEIIAECIRLGIREDEDEHVHEVGELSLACPLPPGWEKVTDDGSGREQQWVYTLDERPPQDQHPMEPYFIELRNRRRLTVEQRKWAERVQAFIDRGPFTTNDTHTQTEQRWALDGRRLQAAAEALSKAVQRHARALGATQASEGAAALTPGSAAAQGSGDAGVGAREAASDAETALVTAVGLGAAGPDAGLRAQAASTAALTARSAARSAASAGLEDLAGPGSEAAGTMHAAAVGAPAPSALEAGSGIPSALDAGSAAVPGVGLAAASARATRGSVSAVAEDAAEASVSSGADGAGFSTQTSAWYDGDGSVLVEVQLWGPGFSKGTLLYGDEEEQYARGNAVLADHVSVMAEALRLVEGLGQQLTDTRARLEALEREKEAAAAAADRSVGEAAAAAAEECRTMAEQLQQAQEAAEKLLQRSLEAEGRVGELSSGLLQAEGRVVELEDQLAALSAARDDAELQGSEAVRVLAQQLQEAQETAGQLLQRCTEAEGRLGLVSAEREEMAARAAELAGQLAALQALREEAMQQGGEAVRLLMQQLQEARATTAKAQEDALADIKRLHGEAEGRLQAERDAAAAETERLRLLLFGAEEAVRQLQVGVANARQRVGELEAQVAAERRAREAAEVAALEALRRAAELQLQGEEESGVGRGLRRQLTEAAQEAERLRARGKEVEEEREVLRARCAQAEDAAEGLRARVLAMESDAAALRVQLADAEARAEQLRLQCSSAGSRAEGLQVFQAVHSSVQQVKLAEAEARANALEQQLAAGAEALLLLEQQLQGAREEAEQLRRRCLEAERQAAEQQRAAAEAGAAAASARRSVSGEEAEAIIREVWNKLVEQLPSDLVERVHCHAGASHLQLADLLVPYTVRHTLLQLLPELLAQLRIRRGTLQQEAMCSRPQVNVASQTDSPYGRRQVLMLTGESFDLEALSPSEGAGGGAASPARSAPSARLWVNKSNDGAQGLQVRAASTSCERAKTDDGRPSFDPRTVPLEWKARADAMLDQDFMADCPDAWREAPDERYQATFAISYLAHLKQLLVRSNRANDELSSKTHWLSGQLQDTIAQNEVLAGQNKELHAKVGGLRFQLETALPAKFTFACSPDARSVSSGVAASAPRFTRPTASSLAGSTLPFATANSASKCNTSLSDVSASRPKEEATRLFLNTYAGRAPHRVAPELCHVRIASSVRAAAQSVPRRAGFGCAEP